MVGSELAKRLLNKFDSLQNIINSNKEELLKIEGLGEQKTKKIIDFLNQKHN